MFLKEEVKKKTHACLKASGFSEILSYTLVSKSDIASVNMPDTNMISVVNPLSIQQSVMRNTLLSGVLNTVQHNLNMGRAIVRVFEDSGVYFKEKEGLREGQSLAIALCGSACQDWNKTPETLDLFYLKGVVQEIVNQLGVSVRFEVSHHPTFESTEALAVLFDPAF